MNANMQILNVNVHILNVNMVSTVYPSPPYTTPHGARATALRRGLAHRRAPGSKRMAHRGRCEARHGRSAATHSHRMLSASAVKLRKFSGLSLRMPSMIEAYTLRKRALAAFTTAARPVCRNLHPRPPPRPGAAHGACTGSCVVFGYRFLVISCRYWCATPGGFPSEEDKDAELLSTSAQVLLLLICE